MRVIELAGIGPAPHAAMLLADLGAEVLRIDRPGGQKLTPGPARLDLLNRGRRCVVLDLAVPGAADVVLRLAERADALVEGMRPGVAERLGVGPAPCLARNPRLVYGRVTGWGQSGPLAARAGHDIDYIALTGALNATGPVGGAPTPPANLLGDFGGGSTFLVIGVLAALWEAQRSGRGQVVDAAIVDGVASLTTLLHALRAAGRWAGGRGENLLDGGAPSYSTYRCADGRYLAVGALEPGFFAEFARVVELPDEAPNPADVARWPVLRAAIVERIATRTRSEWEAAFAGTDACVAPVLDLAEAAGHPHLAGRATFIRDRDVVQPAPAPRFSRTPGAIQRGPALPGEHTTEALADWGIDDVEELLAAGIAVQAPLP